MHFKQHGVTSTESNLRSKPPWYILQHHIQYYTRYDGKTQGTAVCDTDIAYSPNVYFGVPALNIIVIVNFNELRCWLCSWYNILL